MQELELTISHLMHLAIISHISGNIHRQPIAPLGEVNAFTTDCLHILYEEVDMLLQSGFFDFDRPRTKRRGNLLGYFAVPDRVPFEEDTAMLIATLIHI